METLLFRLRRKDAPRIIWIDAIRINQNNATERNLQVSKMPDIYKKASEVLIWLGEDREYGEMVFDFL
jgi:hypothetical protein